VLRQVRQRLGQGAASGYLLPQNEQWPSFFSIKILFIRCVVHRCTYFSSFYSRFQGKSYQKETAVLFFL
jgi:hypothetical protein